MSKPHYVAVFVSPHLDDAVFSCAGEISRLAVDGHVLVLNVFTRHPSESRQHGVVLGSQRLREEIEAAGYLGYESVNLDEVDAPLRRAAYRSVGNLFRQPIREDLNDVDRLRARIIDYLAGVEFEKIYVPLGIGWHVDHILAHLVFEPWATRPDCYYYEDVPYCLIPHATRYRLDELGSYPIAAIDVSLSPTPQLRAWWEASMAYADTAMMRNLRPWIMQKFAVPAVSLYLYRLMALHRRQASLRRTASRLQLVAKVKLTETLARKKVEAMGLYGSQFKEFFSSRADCLASFVAYAQRAGGDALPIERYWQVKAPFVSPRGEP